LLGLHTGSCATDWVDVEEIQPASVGKTHQASGIRRFFPSLCRGYRLSPLWGLSIFCFLLTACAVGCILAPLRGCAAGSEK
jgi:hypothetical protein